MTVVTVTTLLTGCANSQAFSNVTSTSEPKETEVAHVSPVITLSDDIKDDTVTLTVGDELDVSKLIKTIKVGGEELKLADDGKLANGTYVIDDSKVDTSKAGTYKLTISAKSEDGEEVVNKTLKVTVEEKETASTTKSDSTSKKSTDSKKSSSTTSKKSSKSNSSTSSSKKSTTSSSSKKSTTTSKSSTSSNKSTASNSSSKSNNASSSSSKNNSTANICDHTYVAEQVKVKDAYDEKVLVTAAYDEQVKTAEAYDETYTDYETTTVSNGGYVCVGCGALFCDDDYGGVDGACAALIQHMLDVHGAMCNDRTDPCTRTVTTPVQKTRHHDATYKTVHHDATYKTVHHDATYKTIYVCSKCKKEK